MSKDKYMGTEGLTVDIAIKRLFELMEKQPLGGNDEKYYLESKKLIQKEFKEILKGSNRWNKVKPLITKAQYEKLIDLI